MPQNISTKIKELQLFETRATELPQLADATHTLPEVRFLVLNLMTDNGTLGQSYALVFHYFPNTLAAAIQDLAEFATDFHVSETQKFRSAFLKEAEYFGEPGLLTWAQGLLNIAMWDAWAKELKQPVWRLFGTCHEKVPVYGSGGWLSYSDEELIDEAQRYVSRGFQSIKVKVGSPQPGRDLERLRITREAVGPHIRIMMDANQGMTVPDAVELARAAEPLGITWFEEPLKHDDYDGFATLRQQTGISIAMGEREFSSIPLMELAKRKAIDFWQPDILRLGGVEPWKESAAIAAGFNLPVLPHYYKDYDVPLLCTIPNAHAAESFDWIDPLIDNSMVIENGFAYPRATPGWGFIFKTDILRPV